MKIYLVVGYYPIKLGKQFFRKEVAAKDKKEALQKVYSQIGSNHKVKRGKITIQEIKSLKAEDVKNPVVRYIVENHS